MFNFNANLSNRQVRRDLLKKIYDAQVIEFTEDNQATQIVTFLGDVLSALPISASKNDVVSLLTQAIDEWREQNG